MKLLYFSWIGERIGVSEETVDLPDSIITLGDLVEWQKKRSQAHGEIFLHDGIVRVAFDQEHVDDQNAVITNVREIAFFPPMTGG